jgi:hypothetical protein
MTPRAFRRILVRLAVVGAVSGSILGVGGALGQVGDEPTLSERPAPKIAVKPSQDEPSTTTMDSAVVRVERKANVQRLDLPEQSTVMRECTGGGSGADTRLGLLERSSVHGHCE